MPDITGGAPYSQTLSASGGIGSYTWTLVGGELPDGFNLSAGGVITGQTTDAYSNYHQYNFIVQVTDSNSNTTTESLSVVVDRLGWDVNDDGITNISDVVMIGLHWNATLGGPNYAANYDVDGNGVININDVVIVGLHWNKTW